MIAPSLVLKACANAGINLDSAFVWSKGDGTRHGGWGERILLTELLERAATQDISEPRPSESGRFYDDPATDR